MKNKIIVSLLLVSILLSKNISAQSFDKGDNVIGLGFGIGGNYGAYKSYSSQTPAIGLMYEKGMTWNAGPGIIGLGGYLGYKSLRYKQTSPIAPGLIYHYDWKWSYTIIGLRGAYHYEFAENLDTYGGLMLAYNVVSFSDKSSAEGGTYIFSGASASGIDLTVFLGARYYFSDQWGVFAELGYGIATLQLGGVYKF